MNFSTSKTLRKNRRFQYTMFILAIVIWATSFFLSRKELNHKITSDVSWLRQLQRTLADSIEDLERQWRETVIIVAEEEWDAENNDRGQAGAKVFGIQQMTFFEGKAVQHILLNPMLGSKILPKPSLTVGEGSFLLTSKILNDSIEGLWVNQPSLPALYVLHKDKKNILVFLLDTKEVEEILIEEIKKKFSERAYIKPTSGYLQIRLNDSEVMYQSGDSDLKKYDPDEKIDHFSSLTAWSFVYRYPRETRVHYNVFILVIGSLLALAIFWLGWWLNREHHRMFVLAESRVSFVNAVSHELRTPLTNIILSADYIEGSLDLSKINRGINQIREESQRLGRMVENVLNFSRFEAGKLVPEKIYEVDVKSLLDNCLNQFRPSFERKNIKLETRFTKLKPLNVDPDFLSQILLNLFSNVEKYAGLNSTAVVSAAMSSTYLKIIVADNGPGIKDKYREKIFESFERIDEVVTTGISGAGLGLAISKELANLLGGDLTLLASCEDTTFQLLLPIT